VLCDEALLLLRIFAELSKAFPFITLWWVEVFHEYTG
jgi:hypothetical protein